MDPQYGDLPGEQDHMYSQPRYPDASAQGDIMPSWENDTDLSSIHPALRPNQPHDEFESGLLYHSSSQDHRYFRSYDPVAQGFARPIFRQEMTESALSPHAVGNLWPNSLEPGQNIRYRSPADSSGISLTSDPSAGSDFALSPGIGGERHDSSVAHNPSTWASPAFDQLSISDATHDWSGEASYMSSLPSTPAASHHRALSMRDLQVTPDAEGEDEPMDDRDTDALVPRILLPEELELSERMPSPTDSGLGQSILEVEDRIVDEGEYRTHRGDGDSDFTPARQPRLPRLPRLRSVTDRRRSLRSPAQQRQNARPAAIFDPQARIHKRRQIRRATATNDIDVPRSKHKRLSFRPGQKGLKLFLCTFHHYGCHQTFANKNEWKRHVYFQHLQLGYFRCDMGTCSPEIAGKFFRGHNDFKRKDLFTQHCRRMHAPWVVAGRGEEAASKKEKDNFEKELEEIRSRCWVDRRGPPNRSACGFCGETFADADDEGEAGQGRSWEERMHHVGRHLEKQEVNVHEEEVDQGLREWAITENIIRRGRNGEYQLVIDEAAVAGPSTVGGRGRRSRRLRGRRSRATVQEVEDDDDDDDTSSDTDAEGQDE
ncbi:hypothetical protein ABEF95_017026 [Exophiala dermatitidis]